MSAPSLREIAAAFLRLGATSYGGFAIMGVMQSELQERRGWVTKPRFVEGLAVVNMLPGATATQLAVFLGYARGGWWGALVGGLGFVLPAFVIMLALSIAYATIGVSPVVRGALYGLGPVVIGVFVAALYRLGRTTVRGGVQAAIGVAAALAVLATPLGVAAVLTLAGVAGLLLFHQRTPRVLAAVVLVIAAVLLVAWRAATPSAPVAAAVAAAEPHAVALGALAVFFFKVGAFTVGGGLAMLAFIQQQVVEQLHWLTPREFVDGLALGQLTPGPILMLAAYVGYKVAGMAGALVAAAAAFLPSFLIMLGVLPVLDRVRTLAWVRAVMDGLGPAVIGVLAVSLVRLVPYAVPDAPAAAILALTVAALLLSRVGPFRLMLAGGLAGVLRDRLVRT
ncbi:MAG TPA: chromate efflux transporter [Methylomirabilota bacterium]|nr:chromate efflux transporter [Methylomirabilota bacterium]